MKLYYSPLSIGGILLLAVGLYLIVVMLRGAWPTYFAFVFAILGLLMLTGDYFIRKSKMSTRTKLIIQLMCIVVPFGLCYLFFSGNL